MKIKEITNYLESIAPLSYQESYDNAGLLTGNPNEEVTGVLLSLDCIETVIEEAISKKCNLVVAHHPIIFGGLKKLIGRNYVERTVIKAIKNDIAIYAIHTNLDNVLNGVNAKIAEKIGLENTKILVLKYNLPQSQEVGSGMIGDLPEPMEASNFLKHLKEKMQVNCIKHTALLGKKIKKIAICGGAGGFLLRNAIAAGADIFITSDYKYHEFFDADSQIVIADIGHYESEQFTKDLLADFLEKQFETLNIHISAVNTNPVNYFV